MITIIGDPVPKQRPRFANGHTYTPAKTKDYEALVAEAWKYHSGETYHGAVEITVRAYLKIPKSASKWDKNRKDSWAKLKGLKR